MPDLRCRFTDELCDEKISRLISVHPQIGCNTTRAMQTPKSLGCSPLLLHRDCKCAFFNQVRNSPLRFSSLAVSVRWIRLIIKRGVADNQLNHVPSMNSWLPSQTTPHSINLILYRAPVIVQRLRHKLERACRKVSCPTLCSISEPRSQPCPEGGNDRSALRPLMGCPEWHSWLARRSLSA